MRHPEFRRALAAALLLAALGGAASAGVTPQEIAFQGKLLDNNNVPRSGTADFVFTLYDAATGGNSLWTETQAGIPVNNGVFSVQLGAVNGLTADIFDRPGCYLEIKVTPSQTGVQELLSPRTALAMSGWAFRAMALGSDKDVGVRAGTVYSTFTVLGNLVVPNGVTASTGTFTYVSASSVTTSYVLTSSVTATATSASIYAINSASGVYSANGTIYADGNGGIYSNGANGIAAKYGVSAASLTASGLVLASSATLTATGNTVYSLSTSSGILVSHGGVTVNGTAGLTVAAPALVHVGYYIHTVNSSAAGMAAACTSTGFVAIAGGCLTGSNKNLWGSYPSSDTADNTAAAGTAVADAATVAHSWSCTYQGTSTGNSAYVICARLGN